MIRKFHLRDFRPCSKRFVLIRDRDERVWSGPYRWSGQTFTRSQKFWYLFANTESANAAITNNGLVGVKVKRIA